MCFCRLLLFFKIYFFEKFFHRGTIRVSNSLDSDQAWQYAWPDLGPKLFAKVISRQQFTGHYWVGMELSNNLILQNAEVTLLIRIIFCHQACKIHFHWSKSFELSGCDLTVQRLTSITISIYTRMQKLQQQKYVCPLPLKIYSLDLRKPVFSVCQ